MNVREKRRANEEWTIQRHWQHWVHKTNTNKTKNRTQKTKKVRNTDPFHQKQGVNPGAREE